MQRIIITFPEPPLFTTRIDVRITDLNYGDHLGHDTLISILHEARVRFFEHHGMKEWDADGLLTLVADLAVCYRAEVHYPQALEIAIALRDPTPASCVMVYRVVGVGSDRVVALATTRVVFIEPDTRQIAPLPATFQRLVEGAPRT